MSSITNVILAYQKIFGKVLGWKKIPDSQWKPHPHFGTLFPVLLLWIFLNLT